jgi:hypothetical protein
MDFYWHYSSKEIIDPAGKINFFKAIGVASQVTQNNEKIMTSGGIEPLELQFRRTP